VTTKQLSFVDALNNIREAAAEFFCGPPFAPGPSTSYEAAYMVVPKLTARRKAALDLLTEAGWSGLTDPELAELMGLPLQSAVPLRNWLVTAGLVTAAFMGGERCKRKNKHGRSCAVWRVK